MRAFVQRTYGGPDVLALESLPTPVPADGEVLVRVHAASVNPLDWHLMRGTPYVLRLAAGLRAPKRQRCGVDFAGVVEATGTGVTRFAPGDHVFGAGPGSFAEYLTMGERQPIARMPNGASFADAAAVPVAGMTALQALRDKGRVAPGQRVLVNGASGGVGTYAVQIAKAAGAEVTATCSARNIDLVRGLGATHLVDYTKDDITRTGTVFDLIIDTVGTHTVADYRRILSPAGTIVIVGSIHDGEVIGPMATLMRAKAAGMFGRQRVDTLITASRAADLETLADMLREGRLTSTIDRRYPFEAAAAAIAYVETGRARGKVVINVIP